MAEIFTFNGAPLEEVVSLSVGEPHPMVVETLERLMDRAKAGEIIGIATVFITRDATGGMMAGMASYGMVGRLEDVKLQLLEELA